jgi:membrane protein required for colicin V production
MNILDYIIIVSMIYLIIKGILRGFIGEVASLAGIILGIWLANLFQPRVTEILEAYIPFTGYIPLISFAVIFGTIFILFNFLGWVLKLLFKKIFLGWLDRALGSLLAIVKGVIVIYLVIVLLTFFIPEKTPLIAESKLAPWITKSYQSMIGLICPDHYHDWKERIVGEGQSMSEIISGRIRDMAENHD